MHSQGQQQRLAPRDEIISTAQHDHGDGSRSSGRANHHYGLSSVTCSGEGQTLDSVRCISSTQTIWQGVIERHCGCYDSFASDLPTKDFESSTLLMTPTPVPRFAVRASTGDSHCARESQKLLHSHSHSQPSHYYPHEEQNANKKMPKMSSSSSTPRSRSIKIERTKRSEPDLIEADTIERTTSLYEMATWNMYNRITEYRRHHPINYDNLDTGCAGSSMQNKSPMFLPRKESSTLYGPRGLNRVLMSVGPVTSREQHKLDGEVFDMEL